MIGLTPRQRDCYEFIKARMALTPGVAPTFDEIMVALDLSSKHRVYDLLNGLEERGYIRRLPHRARAIELVDRDGAEQHLRAVLGSFSSHNGGVGLLWSDAPAVVSARKFIEARP